MFPASSSFPQALSQVFPLGRLIHIISWWHLLLAESERTQLELYLVPNSWIRKLSPSWLSNLPWVVTLLGRDRAGNPAQVVRLQSACCNYFPTYPLI